MSAIRGKWWNYCCFIRAGSTLLHAQYCTRVAAHHYVLLTIIDMKVKTSVFPLDEDHRQWPPTFSEINDIHGEHSEHLLLLPFSWIRPWSVWDWWYLSTTRLLEPSFVLRGLNPTKVPIPTFGRTVWEQQWNIRDTLNTCQVSVECVGSQFQCNFCFLDCVSIHQLISAHNCLFASGVYSWIGTWFLLLHQNTVSRS